MRKLVILLLQVLAVAIIYGQTSSTSHPNTIGIQQVINYNNQQFHGGMQTWNMVQDKNGILYFANNDGLLTYNGKFWNLYPIPNKTILRSLALDPSGKIYAGAQDEMGYFFPDKTGQLVYTSLKPFLPQKDRQFADIWNIVITPDGVFFRASDRIFQITEGEVRVYYAPQEWRLLTKAGGKLYTQDKLKGLLYYNNGEWLPACSNPTNKILITSVMEYKKDTLLLTTLTNGVYLLANEHLTKKRTCSDKMLMQDRIYSAIPVSNDCYALGTVVSGCYILNKQGDIIQSFSKQEGLQNDNVLSLFSDRDNNIWLGLDNGIDYIAYNSAVKRIYPDPASQASCYATRIFNNKLYVGTSNGLYSLPIQKEMKDLGYEKGSFSPVANTTGQVWNLSEVNGKLLMGHHEGAFEIDDNSATLLTNVQGCWLFRPLSSTTPSPEVLMGTYSGLHLLSYSDGDFEDRGEVDGINESLRFLVIDKNTIWASHPYRGVFKFELSGDNTSISPPYLYTDKDGLPSSLNNYVSVINKKIVVSTEKGIYEYNATLNKFEHSTFLNDVFGTNSVRRLTEDSSGNIWFVSNQQVGVVDFHRASGSKNFTIVWVPELSSRLVTGFEYIYPYDDENVFIGSSKGLFHINYAQYVTSSESLLRAMICTVKASDKKDSLLFGGYFSNGKEILAAQDQQQIPILSYKLNSFHFEYSSAQFAQQNNLEYSYRLAGFDKAWSEWSTKTEKDYTNLPFGDYRFEVKVRNNLGIESEAATYAFTILPAWYQSIGAVIIYILIAGALIFWLIKKQQQRFRLQQEQYEEEQGRLQYMHKLELDRNEKEIVQLQNEKLATEVHFKNKELATVTMHLVERGKMISKIKEEIGKQMKNNQSAPYASEFKSIWRLLNDAEKNDEDWEHFAIHFDEVHSNFLSNLKAKYPMLSNTDLRLCAYLRINLSSKEIAQLLNISVKSVEISRYRLRKKLQIPAEMNLYDFLLGAVRQ